MANKTGPAKPDQETRAKPIDKRVMVIALKGSPEFRDWLTAAAKKTRIPASNIVEVALAKWATENGIAEPPDR